MKLANFLILLGFFLSFNYSRAQTISASQGFGPFVEGLPLENEFTYSGPVPAGTEHVLFIISDAALSEEYGYALDAAPGNNSAKGTIDMKTAKPGAVLTAFFLNAANNMTGLSESYSLQIKPKPLWAKDALIYYTATNGDSITWTVYNPINFTLTEYLPAGLTGLSGRPFGVEAPYLAYYFTLDKHTGEAKAAGECILFNLNTLGLHTEFRELSLGAVISFDQDLNFSLIASGHLETNSYSFALPGISFPLAPFITIKFDAGLTFQASLDGKIVAGNQGGQWGFLQSGTEETSLLVKADGEGYIRGNVNVLGGMLSADATLTLRARLGAGIRYRNIPAENTDLQFGGDYSLLGQVNVKAFSFRGSEGAGVYTYGPKAFVDESFGSYPGTLTPVYDPDNAQSIVNTYRINESFVLPEFSPEPVFTGAGEHMGAVWVDNTAETSALLFSILNKSENKFEPPLILAENTHGINNPSLAFTPDGSAFITYCQNRYDLSNLPSGISVQDLLEAQDIYLAFYDAASKAIVYNEMLADDISGFQTGRAESRAKVTVNGSDFALITWMVQENAQSRKNSIWYTTLTLTGSTWYLAQPQQLTNIPGVNKDLQVKFNEAHDYAVLVWINDPDGNENTRDSKLYATSYINDAWETPEVIEGFEGASGFSFDELSFDMNDDYAIIGFTTTSETNEGLKNEFYIGVYHQSQDVWDYYIADEGADYNFYKPVVSVNSQSVASATFQKIRPVYTTDSIDQGRIELYLKNLRDDSPWKEITNSPLVADSTFYVWEMDASFGDDDKLYILTQETDSIAGNEDQTPKNGIVFGVRELNMVLRGLEVKDNLEITGAFLPDGTVTNINKKKLAYKTSFIKNIYPNPFTDFSTIEYRLERSGKAEMSLYDLYGNQVRELISAYLGPGSYQTIIEKGTLLPGIYLLKITIGESSESVKLVIK